jgi:N-acetylmuramoyl-L-alanine amidase
LHDRSLSALPQIVAAAAVLGIAVSIVVRLAGQGAAPLTLLSRDARRSLPVTAVGNQEFVALEDLAALFQLSVREEAGAITVAYRTSTIVLTPDQSLASVSGRLISLPTAPTRVGGRWHVPLDFINRALAPVYSMRLDFRRASRLLVIGDIRVPSLTVRFEPLGNAVRVTIDATPPATSTITQEATRLTIRFDADALDLVALPTLPPQGLVQGIRRADPVSLALDLGPRHGGFRSVSQTTGNSARLLIDLAAAATETATPPTPSPPPPADLPQFGQPVSAIRTIAIDPGHGGEDQGTVGTSGLTEKNLTLAVARRLRSVIEGRLGVRVLLTRDEDRRVPVEERTAVANNNKADLFISLHANASMRPEASGAGIYGAAFDEAARASTTRALERVQVFGGGLRDIELVPWELAQIRHADYSLEFARVLEEQFRGRVPMAPRPVERAPFRVLESANMPAVLVEMGYLTNPAQESQLADTAFQAAFVQALYDAVIRFRDYLTAQAGDR